MIRGTAMLLAPHASRLHALMAASPPHVALVILGALLAVFLIWTVITVNPRRSR